jgi:manganese transport protein
MGRQQRTAEDGFSSDRTIARMVLREQVDILVVGGHRHKGLSDLLHGQTINGVRHAIDIPILAVRR